MRAVNIEWDMDYTETGDLPAEMDIPDEVFEGEEDLESVLDAISDYLSDTTGFCHEGFNVEMTDTEKERYEITDTDKAKNQKKQDIKEY